ncbi:MAG: HAD-IA family hydrolase [Treponema sp.]|jgi:putative hydrolase of the HAD superfamily|nr:HAD-IA family hydrolase [Treponema sp.]
MHHSIEYILFDLDGTLYSSRWGLEQAVSSRVNDYIAEYLKLPREEAWARRKERIQKGGYGTTLEWLRAEEGLNDEEMENYFAYMHPEHEADTLPPDPALRSFLLSLSSRNIPFAILTNSIMEHADRILDKLKVADLFPVIYDMRKNGFRGKPDAVMFRNVLNDLGVTAPSCCLIDDVPFYVEGYQAIGGTGILLDEDNKHQEFGGFRIQKLEELLNLHWHDGTPLFP